MLKEFILDLMASCWLFSLTHHEHVESRQRALHMDFNSLMGQVYITLSWIGKSVRFFLGHFLQTICASTCNETDDGVLLVDIG